MKLAKLQATMASWVLDPNASHAPDGVAPIKDLSALGGAKLYRNSILEVEIRALTITFPIVLDLVGDKFFRTAAISYLRGTNPHSANDGLKNDGNLDTIGDAFPEFLPTMEGTRETPYLADVARLELAVEAASVGPDTADLTQETLQALAGDPASIGCKLCPNATLIKSDFPIDEIRSAYLDGFKQELDISNQTEETRLIVWRPDDEVQLSSLTSDEWALLNAVKDNNLFLDAIERATTSRPELDLPTALSNAVTNRWLETTSV